MFLTIVMVSSAAASKDRLPTFGLSGAKVSASDPDSLHNKTSNNDVSTGMVPMILSTLVPFWGLGFRVIDSSAGLPRVCAGLRAAES